MAEDRPSAYVQSLRDAHCKGYVSTADDVWRHDTSAICTEVEHGSKPREAR